MLQGAEKLKNPIEQALDLGQSIWFDGLVSKEEFRKMIEEDGLRGATTNPTIFEKEIANSSKDAEWAHFIETHTPEEIYQKIAVKAVGELADLFLPVFEKSKGRDGFVSIEVNPLLAHKTYETIEEARHLHRLVKRPNVMVKVPATLEGIPAIETLIAEGISINVTLIFSIARYEAVINAYLSGLEKRLKQGQSLSGIASVASFFVSRVDTAVDKELDEKIKSEELKGRAAIANSKLAYERFQKIFSSPRFKALSDAGAQVQRPLWASTGTKNPRYSDVLYVESLIGPQTVNTLPPATFAAFKDHGKARASLTQALDAERAVLKNLENAGISLERVTGELERVGVSLFSDSYNKIIEWIRTRKIG
jgi:transaldolase